MPSPLGPCKPLGHMDGHSNPLLHYAEQRGTCQSIPSGPSFLARPDGCFPPVTSPRVFQESSHPTPSARPWIRLHFAPASLGFWLPKRRDGAGLNLHRWEDKRRGKEAMGAKDPFNHPALRKSRPDRVSHWLLKPDAACDWPASIKPRPWRQIIGLRFLRARLRAATKSRSVAAASSMGGANFLLFRAAPRPGRGSPRVARNDPKLLGNGRGRAVRLAVDVT